MAPKRGKTTNGVGSNQYQSRGQSRQTGTPVPDTSNLLDQLTLVQGHRPIKNAAYYPSTDIHDVDDESERQWVSNKPAKGDLPGLPDPVEEPVHEHVIYNADGEIIDGPGGYPDNPAEEADPSWFTG